MSATLFRILGKVTDRDTTTVPVDLSFEPTPAAYRKRFGALCRPSWQWINAQPEGSLTRADKPVDEDGRIPYFFRGSAEAIEAPLLYGEWGLTPRQRRDARVMISRWLWDEVTWWKTRRSKSAEGNRPTQRF